MGQIRQASFNDVLGSLSLEQQYRICLYGKLAFQFKEWEAKTTRDKHFIEEMHKRAQESINLLKQRRLIELSNAALQCWHNAVHHNFVDEIMMEQRTCKGFFCNLGFKDLGINKDMVVDHLVQEKIIRLRKSA